jgi:hypothetical protein
MIVIDSITPGAAAKLELVFNKLGFGATTFSMMAKNATLSLTFM